MKLLFFCKKNQQYSAVWKLLFASFYFFTSYSSYICGWRGEIIITYDI